MAPFLKEVVTAEPASFELFRTAIRRALHLEMRDGYPPDDPDWLEWKAGGRFDPAERWRVWGDLMRETTGRGVEVRRARIVSEPLSEYIRSEYDVTGAHNVAAGEQSAGCRAGGPQVCLPRRTTSGCSTSVWSSGTTTPKPSRCCRTWLCTAQTPGG